MSARIAPLPDGMGIASIADKQPGRQRDGHKGPGARAAAGKAGSGKSPSSVAPAFTPASEESLPAGTLFAATVLSSGIEPGTPSLTELRIRGNRDWTPPDSILRLRDKTI